MSYQVSARKYRPQTFADLEGQGVAVRALQNAIRRNRISHAFLFSGPRGVGKTTMARLVAKALNCFSGPAEEPCSQCDACREIVAGVDMDVIEIDAASNRGIDDIRQLREGVRFAPVRDRFKVYIIDEVHQLTKEAFSALLKTLEEPPGHVKFILATTEKEQVPITIRSRCQQFDFQLIPVAVIAARLKKILALENISYSDRILEQIALAAEGSLRDALSLLDQVIAYCGAQAADEEAEAVLGVIDFALLERLTQAVGKQDTEDVLRIIEEVFRAGFDLQMFCLRLLHHFRNLMVAHVVGANASLLNVTAASAPQLQALAKDFSLCDLMRFVELLGRAEAEMRRSYFPRFTLELALLKITALPRLESLAEILAEFRAPGGAPFSSPVSVSRPTEPPSPTAAPPPSTSLPATSLLRAIPSSTSSPRESVERVSAPNRNADPAAFLKRLGELLPKAVTWLETALPIRVQDNAVWIRFPETYRSVWEKLREESCLSRLRQAAEEVYGAGVHIRLELEEKEGVSASFVPPEQQKESEWMKRIRKDPLVAPFLEHFPGEIRMEEK